jgi:hypothetical protein
MKRFLEWVFPFDNYEDFEDVIDSLMGDPFDARIITELCMELIRDGSFRTPLRVASGQLSNGYHRFCALSVSHVDEFDVWVVENGVFESDLDAAPVTDITLRVRPGDDRFKEDPDGFSTAAFFAARSLGHKGNWLDADGASLHEDLLTYTYYVDVDTVTAAASDIIVRLASAGVHAELVSVQVSPD